MSPRTGRQATKGVALPSPLVKPPQTGVCYFGNKVELGPVFPGSENFFSGVRNQTLKTAPSLSQNVPISDLERLAAYHAQASE